MDPQPGSALWSCPTCRTALDETNTLFCKKCGKRGFVDKRFLDFLPLTPELNVGLGPVLQHVHEKIGESYRDDTGDPRVTRALQRISEHAEGGLCVEIGSANGPMTPTLENIFDNVIAVDHSESLLRGTVARTRSACCVLADAQYLPLRDGCVDFVVLTEVLEHVTVPTQILLEIVRILKPDGRVFIAVPNERTLNPFAVTNKKPPRSTHVNFFDSIGLSRLMIRCGFELVDVRTHTPKLNLVKILRNPWRLRKLLPGLGKYVECIAQPAAEPLACWEDMLKHKGASTTLAELRAVLGWRNKNEQPPKKS